MEILNNIWNVISVPNEGLINIFLMLGTFIESYLILILIKNAFSLNPPKRNKLIFLVLNPIIGCISLNIPAPFNTITNYFSLYINLFFI